MVDGHTRRRPFAWMKRLANLKSSSSTSPQRTPKKNNIYGHSKSKSHNYLSKNNNPYPESGHLPRQTPTNDVPTGRTSYSTALSETASSYTSSFVESNGAHHAPMRSNKSAAPTLATNPETVHSDAGFSKAGTSHTNGGGLSSRDGGANSTFSSPNHSDRSLTTTLTTIQSTAPSGLLNPTTSSHTAPASPNPANHANFINFSQPHPASPPASAVPSHLQHQLHPHTYSAATANNILTDDASIMTLASSSKRRRRRSLDTDASVRALAPSSLFGNSRESLPLSVLSGNDVRPPVGGLAGAERASVYSSSGVTAPALSSERNSYYADKTKSISSQAGVSGFRDIVGGGDNASVRSGLIGHGKTDSISGISVSSPLQSPREASITGKLSRKGSDWGKGDVEEPEAEAMYEENSSEDGERERPGSKANGHLKEGDGGSTKNSV